MGEQAQAQPGAHRCQLLGLQDLVEQRPVLDRPQRALCPRAGGAARTEARPEPRRRAGGGGRSWPGPRRRPPLAEPARGERTPGRHVGDGPTDGAVSRSRRSHRLTSPRSNRTRPSGLRSSTDRRSSVELMVSPPLAALGGAAPAGQVLREAPGEPPRRAIASTARTRPCSRIHPGPEAHR